MLSRNSAVKLTNGLDYPTLGFGTFRLRNKTQFKILVEECLAQQVKLFDTAKVYGNEKYFRDFVQSSIPEAHHRRRRARAQR